MGGNYEICKNFLYVLFLITVALCIGFLSIARDDMFTLLIFGFPKIIPFLIATLIIMLAPILIKNKKNILYLSLILSLWILFYFVFPFNYLLNYYFYRFIISLHMKKIYLDIYILLFLLIIYVILFIYIISILVKQIKNFSYNIETIIYTSYLIVLAFISLSQFTINFLKTFFLDIYNYYKLNLITIFHFIKQDLLIYMGLILLYLYWRKKLFLDSNKKTFTKKRNKIIYFILWLIFGFFGLERFYLQSKYNLINFQSTTSIMLASTIYFFDYIIENNIILIFVMIILCLIKIYYFLTSFYYSIKFEFE